MSTLVSDEPRTETKQDQLAQIKKGGKKLAFPQGDGSGAWINKQFACDCVRRLSRRLRPSLVNARRDAQY